MPPILLSFFFQELTRLTEMVNKVCTYASHHAPILLVSIIMRDHRDALPEISQRLQTFTHRYFHQSWFNFICPLWIMSTASSVVYISYSNGPCQNFVHVMYNYLFSCSRYVRIMSMSFPCLGHIHFMPCGHGHVMSSISFVA